MVTTRPGSRIRPACIGLSPSTSCRCWETKNRKPTSEKTLSRLASTAPLNDDSGEQPDVEHRLRPVQLAPDERGAGDQADGDQG